MVVATLSVRTSYIEAIPLNPNFVDKTYRTKKLILGYILFGANNLQFASLLRHVIVFNNDNKFQFFS
jgi:hypothetical protein